VASSGALDAAERPVDAPPPGPEARGTAEGPA